MSEYIETAEQREEREFFENWCWPVIRASLYTLLVILLLTVDLVVLVGQARGAGSPVEEIPALDPTPELPPLEDLDLFAYQREQVMTQLTRHDQHVAWLVWRTRFSLCTDDRTRFASQVAETKERRELWDMLDNALKPTSDAWCEETRRENLAHLLFRLGETAYYCGEMPRPLPAGLPREPPVSVPIGENGAN